MDKVQKYNSFNTNTPSSESYRNYLQHDNMVDLHKTVDSSGFSLSVVHFKGLFI
jgi:hypothetical protein